MRLHNVCGASKSIAGLCSRSVGLRRCQSLDQSLLVMETVIHCLPVFGTVPLLEGSFLLLLSKRANEGPRTAVVRLSMQPTAVNEDVAIPARSV